MAWPPEPRTKRQPSKLLPYRQIIAWLDSVTEG